MCVCAAAAADMAGVLALPYSLLQAGLIAGAILLVVSAAATAVSVRLLVRASDYYSNYHPHHDNNHHGSSSNTCNSSYESLAERVVSKQCRTAVEASMLLFCGGCAVAYMIAVGDILEQSGLTEMVFGKDGGSNDSSSSSRTYSMLAVYVVAMLPLSMLRRVRSLQFASAVGIAAIGTLVLAAFIHWIRDLDSSSNHQNNSNNHHYHNSTTATTTVAQAMLTALLQRESSPPLPPPVVRLSDFLWPAHGLASVLTAAPVVLFAFSCQTNVCGIYSELLSGQQMPEQSLLEQHTTTTTAAAELLLLATTRTKQELMRRVTITAVCICAALYTSVSIIALADFGGSVQPNMLSCYDDIDSDPMMQVATAAMAFAVVMAFPLNIFPARVTLIGLIEEQKRRRRRNALPTTRVVSEMTASATFRAAALVPTEGLTVALLQDEEEQERTISNIDNDAKADGGDNSVGDAATDHRLLPMHPQYDGEQLPLTASFNRNSNGVHAVEGGGNAFDLRIHILTTLFLTGTALALALILPNISVVFGLLGGTASSLLGFCVPGLLGMRLAKDLREETGELQLGTLAASWLLLIGGVAVGVLTTGVTIYNTLIHHASL